MLVLSRKPNESISIGETIRIVIIEVRGDKIRLGIEAPIDLRVLRSELLSPMVPSLAAPAA